MTLDFSDICRLCIGEKKSMLPLFEVQNELPAKIKDISIHIEVSVGDGLPTNVCQQCVQQVNMCYNFKLQCERSHATLRRYLSNEQHKNQSYQNIERESSYDDSVLINLNLCAITSTTDASSISPVLTDSCTNEDLSSDDKYTPEVVVNTFKSEVLDIRDCASGVRSKNSQTCTVKNIEDSENQGRQYNRKKAESMKSTNHSKDCESMQHVNLRSTMRSTTSHKCSVCSKRFNNNYDLKRHVTVHTGERAYHCTVCTKSFKRKAHLNEHSRLHTGEGFKCSVCIKKFTTLKALYVHSRTHTGEKPYLCQTCGMKFTQKGNLLQHTRKHTGEKPFKCSICHKQYATRNALKIHNRTHTGERPFMCDICGKKFSDDLNFKKHTRIHTGDRPYVCLVCNKKFNTRDEQKRHHRTHTGEKPYSCSTCDKSFNDRNCLTSHVRVHTGEKPYVCMVCKKAFAQRVTLKRHFRQHTGEKPYQCQECNEAFALRRDLNKHMERNHMMGE